MQSINKGSGLQLREDKKAFLEDSHLYIEGMKRGVKVNVSGQYIIFSFFRRLI